MLKYSVTLQWSDEDAGFVSLIPELPGVSAVGKTPEKAVAEALRAAQACIESLKEEGRTVPEPNLLAEFSGQLRLRMPKTLHAMLSAQAKTEGMSLNSYILHLLSIRAGEKRIENMLASKLGQRRTEVRMLHFPLAGKTRKTIPGFGKSAGGTFLGDWGRSTDETTRTLSGLQEDPNA